jgi:hypothetical protein
VSEVVGAFLGRKLVEDFSDFVPQGVDRAFGGFAQESFEFGEGHFDGIEVGRIWREIEEDCAGGLDEGAHLGDLVGGQVVHDDEVAGSERRDQALLQPGQKDVAIHRPVEDIGRCDSVVAEARHEGCRLPIAVGRPSDQPFAAFATPAQAGHRRVRSGLVDEDDFVRIKRGLIALPDFAGQSHVGAQLLGCVKAFF